MESMRVEDERSEVSTGNSAFESVARAPDIPVYATMVACSRDPSPDKLNLGVGVYRTADGEPHVLNVVKRAELLLVNDVSLNKEYLPITGMAEFNKLSAELIFGPNSPAIKESRVTTVQCLSGTGSLRIGAEFLAKHYPQKIVYLSQPTYDNHPNFFIATGHILRTYRYYDPATCGLDFEGLMKDLESAASGAIVLFQACSHNPTGVDPTLEQWEQIRRLMRSKGLLPFFDSAYQGFLSGNLDVDAQSVRIFVEDGGECLVAQSYSKIMGLYGERVGALSIVCKTADVATRVESQLKLVIRPMYSNPPIHGAAIVCVILKDRKMYEEWTVELKAMIDRIIKLRQLLYDALHDRGTPGDWSHILKQGGLYTYSGLNAAQVRLITTEFHIYMSSNGRINMSGLSTNTVPRLANAILAAVTHIT